MQRLAQLLIINNPPENQWRIIAKAWIKDVGLTCKYQWKKYQKLYLCRCRVGKLLSRNLRFCCNCFLRFPSMLYIQVHSMRLFVQDRLHRQCLFSWCTGHRVYSISEIDCINAFRANNLLNILLHLHAD